LSMQLAREGSNAASGSVLLSLLLSLGRFCC
jgi:hypothetical protein